MKIKGKLEYFCEQGMEGNAVLKIQKYNEDWTPTLDKNGYQSYDDLVNISDFDYIKVYGEPKIYEPDILVYHGPVYFGRILLRKNFNGYLFKDRSMKLTEEAEHSQIIFGEAIIRLPYGIKWDNPFISIDEWIELFELGYRAEAWTKDDGIVKEEDLMFGKQGNNIEGHYKYLG